MVQGIAITTDTCHQAGDGAGFRAHAATHANAGGKDLLACQDESQVGFEG